MSSGSNVEAKGLGWAGSIKLMPFLPETDATAETVNHRPRDEPSIFKAILQASDPASLFELGYAYFWSKGFSAFCYVAPEAPAGPYRLMHRGMPEQWITNYENESLQRDDPIPRLALRYGRPARVSQLIEQADGLNDDETKFMASLATTELTDGIVLPVYGPFGRPALLCLGMPVGNDIIDSTNLPLKWAIAQLFHIQMALMESETTEVRLSPRERTVLEWLARGKSTPDIATILSIAIPTVSTHIRRIYGKFGVHDRITCVTKARALHYV